MFFNPFSFEGRIHRLEYGISLVIYGAILTFLQIAAEFGAAYLYILIFPAIYFLLAQGTKRCHDLGLNGCWQLIPLYFVVLVFYTGTKELNEYGYPPVSHNHEKEMTMETGSDI